MHIIEQLSENLNLYISSKYLNITEANHTLNTSASIAFHYIIDAQLYVSASVMFSSRNDRRKHHVKKQGQNRIVLYVE